MVSEMYHFSEAIDNLSPDDQNIFIKEKENYLNHQLKDSPLLDQICYVQLVIIRLTEEYKKSLDEFEKHLEERIGKPEGWRDSMVKKEMEEFESPMPWLHPFKLAAEELKILKDELGNALMSGEMESIKPEKLQEVMNRYHLRFPLSFYSKNPQFLPRSIKVYK